MPRYASPMAKRKDYDCYLNRTEDKKKARMMAKLSSTEDRKKDYEMPGLLRSSDVRDRTFDTVDADIGDMTYHNHLSHDMSFDEQAKKTLSVLDKVAARSKAHQYRNLPALHQPKTSLDTHINGIESIKRTRRTSAYKDAFGSSSLKL